MPTSRAEQVALANLLRDPPAQKPAPSPKKAARSGTGRKIKVATPESGWMEEEEVIEGSPRHIWIMRETPPENPLGPASQIPFVQHFGVGPNGQWANDLDRLAMMKKNPERYQ